MSDIYNDVLRIISFIHSGKQHFFMNFLCSAFTARWCFSIIDDEKMEISAEWFTVIPLNKDNIENSMITVSISSFINEWNALFKKIKEDLLLVGYDDSLENFSYVGML